VKIGVVCLSLSCMDFIDVLDFVQDVGGEAIELCTVKGAHNGTLNLSDENRLSILRTVESFGLSIASVAGYNDFTSHVTDELQREVERLEYYCKLAADLSVNIVRAMGAIRNQGYLNHKWFGTLFKASRLQSKWLTSMELRLPLRIMEPLQIMGLP